MSVVFARVDVIPGCCPRFFSMGVPCSTENRCGNRPSRVRLPPVSTEAAWSIEFTSPLSPEDSLRTARGLVGGDAREVDLDLVAGTLRVKKGSRLTLRLTGGGSLPVLIYFDATANEAGGTAMVVTMESDKGWYLLELQSLTDKYEWIFQQLVEQLRASDLRPKFAS